jgi:hypothetical protein
MPTESVPTRGKRAQLIKLNNDHETEGDPFRVQFNPQSLSVRYNSTLSGTKDEDQAEKQQTGGWSTSMDVELFFDVTRPTQGGDQTDANGGGDSAVQDVRTRTKRVQEFMQEAEGGGQTNGGENGQNTPQPNVRFVWGSFQYDGVITQMTEDLEFFDPEGRPLRATVSLSLSGQKPRQEPVDEPDFAGVGGNPRAGEPGPEVPPPGAENTNGTPLQQLAGEVGAQGNWKEIADQNDIDNPRSIHNPGAVNLSASASASASASVSGSISG